MLVVCAGVPVGEGVGVGDGATVFVVCGWVPAAEALGRGTTVAVGTGLDCRGVTVAVGLGPAGTLLIEGEGLGVSIICATACLIVRDKTIAPPRIPNMVVPPKILFCFLRIPL